VLIPQRRAVVAGAVWCGAGILAAVNPASLILWQVFGAGLVAVLLADWWLLRDLAGGLDLRRELGRIVPVGGWHPVVLRLANRGRAVWLTVQEVAPQGFEVEHDRQSCLVPAGGIARLAYRVRPLERGTHAFGPAAARLHSPLGWWFRQQSLGTVDQVRVYPDFARIVQYELLATDHRLSQMGVLQRRRRGQGAEFHQLRDYRQDDSPRQIDWKATARMTRLISREYEDERDQQVVLVLDCSQRMRARDGDLSHMDHALNAMLLLAYVALRQGDAVGLATFGHDAPRFLAPRASLGTMPQLLNATYDLQPSLHVPDFVGLARDLRRRLARRALVVLATTVREEDAEGLRSAVQLLGRHRLVVASLEEAAVTAARERPITSLDDALVFAAGADYRARRRRAVATLRHAGVAVLDTRGTQLMTHLVNHYWETKRAGAA